MYVDNTFFALTVVTLVNDLLLVMIIMEVLRTVLSYPQECATSLQPFRFSGNLGYSAYPGYRGKDERNGRHPLAEQIPGSDDRSGRQRRCHSSDRAAL